ncbi:mycofactocin precursor MftA [Nocardia sp. NPDC050378]
MTVNTWEVVMAENPAPVSEDTGEDLIAETLIEEVSIDGMCGVY